MIYNCNFANVDDIDFENQPVIPAQITPKIRPTLKYRRSKV